MLNLRGSENTVTVFLLGFISQTKVTPAVNQSCIFSSTSSIVLSKFTTSGKKYRDSRLYIN